MPHEPSAARRLYNWEEKESKRSESNDVFTLSPASVVFTSHSVTAFTLSSNERSHTATTTAAPAAAATTRLLPSYRCGIQPGRVLAPHTQRRRNRYPQALRQAQELAILRDAAVSAAAVAGAAGAAVARVGAGFWHLSLGPRVSPGPRPPPCPPSLARHGSGTRRCRACPGAGFAAAAGTRGEGGIP